MKTQNHRTRKLLTLLVAGMSVCWLATDVAQAQPDLLVTNPQGPNIRRFDGQTGAFAGDFVTTGSGGLLTANGMVFGPDGNLYVTDGVATSSSTILRYDGDTGAFIDVFVTAGSGGLFFPHSAVFGPDGNLYVTTHQGDSVLRYDGQTGAFIDAFVPAGSGGLDLSVGFVFGPDENLYVVSRISGAVKRYDGQTGAFIDNFVAPGAGGLDSPAHLAFGPDGNLYVTSGGSGCDCVKRYDGLTGAFIDDFVAPGSGGLNTPRDLAFRSDGKLYIVCGFGCGVKRYDAQTGAFIDTFVSEAGSGPTELLFFENDTDSDGDGVDDADDACPDSDLSPTIVIDGVDTGVANNLLGDGCSLSDLIAQLLAADASTDMIVQFLVELMGNGIITGRDMGAILRALNSP